MRFLIIDTYYEKFLESFYKKYPEVSESSFSKDRKKLLEECFGTSDFYSRNLKKLGYEAEDIIVNDFILQMKWAKENNLKFPTKINYLFDKLTETNKLFKKFFLIFNIDNLYQIFRAQIEFYKPDILFIHNLGFFSDSFLKSIKKKVKLIIGQIAYPLPPFRSFKYYDLILTSFPHYVEMFKAKGIKSEYFKLAFEKSVLERLQKEKEQHLLTFVGGFENVHSQGTRILEEVAKHLPLKVWGYGIEKLPVDSPLRKCYQGEVWGLNMYNILYNSKITLNRHSSAAKNFANNMRLYEATGVGAMLITDYKDNLNELFKVDEEVESYSNPEELIKKIKFYLENEEKRQEIAKKGQERTLREHNYELRMKELINILEEYL